MSYPLDTWTTAAVAYSTRKLRAAYAGACMRVRRSSDNAEADIGFSGEHLDEAALLAHVGADAGFVTMWYDQSGNSRNLIQATAANQPVIVSTAAGITRKFRQYRPALFFDGSADVMISSGWTIAQPNTVFVVTENSLTGNGYLFAGNHSTNNNSFGRFNGFFRIQSGSTVVNDDTPAFMGEGTYSMLYNGASSKWWFNGTEKISGDAGTNSMQGLELGRNQGGTLRWRGWVGEFIIYNSDRSADRTAIEQDLQDHWRAGGSPVTLTRQNGGVPIFTDTDWGLDGLYFLRPYKFDVMPAAAGAAEYVWVASSDHGATIAAKWGTGDNLDGSDFTLGGSLPAGETPCLVYNPDDPNGRPYYLYIHDAIAGAKTDLFTAANLSADGSGWTYEGIALNTTGGGTHTGYAWIERLGTGDWRAASLWTNSPADSTTWTSTDGKTWTKDTTLDTRTMLLPDRRLGTRGANIVTIDGVDWMINMEIDENSIGDAASGGRLSILRIPDYNTFIAPSLKLLYYEENATHETDNSRSVNTYVEPDGMLHVYPIIDNKVVYSTGMVDPLASTPPTIAIDQGAAVNLMFGSSLQLTTTPTDWTGDPPTVTWESDDPDIVTISPTTGIATAVGLGTATITATADDGTDQATDTIDITGTAPVWSGTADFVIRALGGVPANA